MFSVIPKTEQKKLKRELALIYGAEEAKKIAPQFLQAIASYIQKNKIDVKKNLKYKPLTRLTEKTSILITYGDSIRRKPSQHFQAFIKFAKKYLRKKIDTIHILPFYPYSSDRGFSVKNYTEVDPKIGTWKDVDELGKDFNLMFDLVLNHASVKGEWFKKFLEGDPKYKDFFIWFKSKNAIPKTQLKKILRPRTNCLLTEFEGKNSKKYVWTTFSADQADLNYKNPKVLLAMLEVLLFYLEESVDFIRLDAVTYAWKKLSTNCAHLPQAHAIVRFFRLVLNVVKPDTAIITETNVPHKDNITYFGNGQNEAQAVYNFTLPPLTLHTFLTQDCTKLTKWAKTLTKPSQTTAYLNFLDSHDGIGLLPAKNILTSKEIDFLVKTTKKHGGLISYGSHPNGTKTPYELNITWFSAINPKNTDLMKTKVRRYLASRAIALSLRGIPHIYVHGLLSSGNDKAYALKTGINRNINRRNLDEKSVHGTFESKGWSRFRTVSQAILRLLTTRSKERAFHPGGKQKILSQNKAVFSLIRSSLDKKNNILALINVSNSPQTFKFNLQKYSPKTKKLTEIISKKTLEADSKNKISFSLEPYAIEWWKF